MGSIVVYKKGGKNKPNRIAGMAQLGDRFNYYQQNHSDPDDVVELTIKELVGTDGNPSDYDVYYNDQPVTWDDGKLKVGGEKLNLKGHKDDTSNKKMEVAVPDAGDLLGGSYLGIILSDLGLGSDENLKKYILGTITFRRCN